MPLLPVCLPLCVQNVGKAIPLLDQVGGSRDPSKQEHQRRQELYEYIETAEEALDESGRSTFRYY